MDETGRKQAQQLGNRIRAEHMTIDLVLISPLTRTLETGTLMFPPDIKRVPFIAVEYCREAFGAHPCDQRRNISLLSKEFPHVDFSLVNTDEDTWHNPDRRETVQEVINRADAFLEILQNRPERNIMVVSHGVFLEVLLSKCKLFVANEELKNSRFQNAEMRSIILGGWNKFS